MAGKLGYGANLKYEATPGGGTYTTAIADVVKIRPYGLKADAIDVSDHDSPSKYREKIPGLLDAGGVQLDINYDQDATTHQYLEAELGVVKNWRITFPGTGRKVTFSGFIDSVTPELPHDNKMTCSVSLVISGVPVWAAAS